MFVGCEVCEVWFHPTCIGLTNEEAKDMPVFVCVACAERAGVLPNTADAYGAERSIEEDGAPHRPGTEGLLLPVRPPGVPPCEF